MKFKLKFRDLKVNAQEALRNRVMQEVAGGPIEGLDLAYLLEVFNTATTLLESEKFTLIAELGGDKNGIKRNKKDKKL